MVMVVIDILMVTGHLLQKKLIKNYKLNSKSKIIDLGCGKGFLLYELKKINS